MVCQEVFLSFITAEIQNHRKIVLVANVAFMQVIDTVFNDELTERFNQLFSEHHQSHFCPCGIQRTAIPMTASLVNGSLHFLDNAVRCRAGLIGVFLFLVVRRFFHTEINFFLKYLSNYISKFRFYKRIELLVHI